MNLEEKLVQKLILLKETSSKIEKQEVMITNKDTPLFKEALVFLLDQFVTIGISTKALKKEIEPQLVYTSFNDILSYLKSNKTGSNENIAILLGYLNQFDTNTKTILSELFSKTLSLGVSAKSVNKAFDQELIQTFSPQLAFSFEKYIDSIDDLDQLYVTKKLDGTRAIVKIKSNHEIEILSRKGFPQNGFNQLKEDLLQFIDKNQHVLTNFPNGFILDGELLLKNNENLSTLELYQKTSKMIRSSGEKTNIELNVFDCLSLPDFESNNPSTHNYKHRRESWLNAMLESEFIKPLPLTAIITKKDIPFWHNIAKTNGWEGLMLNTAAGFYQKKRSKDVLKVKEMKTADVEIIGFNQATSGKFKGKLKSLIVDIGNGNTTDVGFGITDELKIKIWDNQDFYLGKMIEMQYFEKSKNQKGGESIRFPGFIQFRFDKTPDDMNIE